MPGEHSANTLRTFWVRHCAGMFDYRYIYLMRKKKRSAWAKLTGQEEIKIGIAKNAKTRRDQVDKAIKESGIELVCAYRVPFARSVEKDLHCTFCSSRYKMKRAGSGAGKTEWFYLNWFEQFQLRMWIHWHRFKYYAYIAIIVILYLRLS